VRSNEDSDRDASVYKELTYQVYRICCAVADSFLAVSQVIAYRFGVARIDPLLLSKTNPGIVT
jgi:hypothetical protein